MPALTRIDEVFVLDLGDDENRFTADWLQQVNEHLSEVIAADGPRALVTTARGKIWSNGLDLDWGLANPEQFYPYVARVQELYARFLAAPMPTVAALQGHAFAAGAMLALTHDSRVMRADRGYFCLPEVDLAVPFTPGMTELLRARLRPQVAHDLMTTGRRVPGPEAVALEIVDAVTELDEVLPTAIRTAAALAAKASPALGTIKSRLYADLIALLRDAAANELG